MAESRVDEFGKRKIYPTNTHPNRAKPWILGKDDWNDRRYEGGWFDGNWDDYETSTENNHVVINFSNDPPPWIGGGGKGRFPVLALPKDQYFDEENNSHIHTERDQSILRKRGFMGTKNDWKNVEITMYFKINTVANSGIRQMAFSVRGGPHHSDGGFFGISPCWATALYVALNHEGEAILDKEFAHKDGHTVAGARIQTFIDDLMGRWIGMKGVFYTKVNGNPYIELWLDKNVNNNWERILFIEDIGDWRVLPGYHNECGGEDNEKITWGGPGVIFKIDGLNRVDMKWVSIREIMPPEGWPLRYLLEARGVPLPFSMRSLAEEYGLTVPISLRELTQLEAERYPFP